MSEENKHTSDETESETNGENQSSKEQSKSETSVLNNETGQSLLEDEEMPTYISLSSPSRRDHLDASNAKQQNRIPVEEEHSKSPCPSDDQGGGSIYVLSSGEESNHPYNDDEYDYGDSDDMDEMDLEHEHRKAMIDDDDDDEDDEDEDDDEDDDERNPLRLPNEDDEDIDTEYEQECFDRVSDDFILNNRIKHHHKGRSLSLQDLSFPMNKIHSPYKKKRHSVTPVGESYFASEQDPLMYSVIPKKQMPPKYQHVESKVKQYIKYIKEQNRKSVEKRNKKHEFVRNRSYEEDENPKQLKATVRNIVIKDYAEKAIKDLQREENEGTNLVYNISQIVKNGENIKTDNKINENQFGHIRKESEYANKQSEKRAQNDDKLEKQNGSVDIDAHQNEYPNLLNRNIKFNNMNQSSLVNGHEQAPAFINLRTVSYEEYMRGSSTNGKKEELGDPKQKTCESEVYNEMEMINAQEMDNSNTSCTLKIENVKSIRMTQDESNFAKANETDKMLVENPEVVHLKAQLTQKDAQYNTLQNVYQKTVAENIKLKEELDTLKKSLAKYENESKPCETKVAAVQTEIIEKSTCSQETETTSETNKKISTSSVASTASSTDQWAESACSPAISIKPPDLTPIFNSDDSMLLINPTPKKLPNPISRTFITSSRILQTLSNLTQGKPRTESSLVHNSKKPLNDNTMDNVLNLQYSSPIQASSSKKRKATEMLGTATCSQPFKIPHTIVESNRRSSIGATDVEFKYTEDCAKPKSDHEQNTSVNKNTEDSTPAENKTEDAGNRDNSVKCFVYAEDENSKSRSFLIQAEEPMKDALDDKNRIQECGPYLLGNLEVRMSEINGTISVWGKEITPEGTSDNEDNAETSIRSPEKKSCNCWQNISHTKFNENPFVCSTNKKPKNPFRFNRSSNPQSRRSSPLNLLRSSLRDDSNDKVHEDHSFNANNCIHSRENCSSPRCRGEWPISNSPSTSQEKLHSCCVHRTEFVDEDRHCDLHHEKSKYDVSPNPSKAKFYSKGFRRDSYKNTFIPDSSKNRLHENLMNASMGRNDVTCKFCTTRRHSFHNLIVNTSHSKCCSDVRDASCTCKSSLENMCYPESSGKHVCNHNISNDNEEDPLISLNRSKETPEKRQRRLSGKRVRGILMDLLKGCGDCRTNNTTLSKNDIQLNVNGPPQIKITPSDFEPTCSTSSQCNERCCHAYARRIETQLEEFRMEMERVRSRSDAILDMLNMLHSVDMN